MTQSYEWENSRWRPISGIPLTDRGFRHGMSVFETIAIRGGKLIFLPQHLAKLRQACAQTGLRAVPEPLNFFEIPFENGVARIYVTAGDGGLADCITDGRIVLLLESETPRPANALRVRFHPRPVTLSWPSLKTGNYWLQLQARQEAAAAHFDEAILVNGSNHVISATTANLFAVIDGLLTTPRVASGARPGVVRDWVLERAEVIVSDFHPAQLLEATEIFLTSSGIGIRPVRELEGKEILDSTVSDKLRANHFDRLNYP